MYGAHIGYEGVKGRIKFPNHGTAFANPQVVSDAIKKELDYGHVRILDTLPEYYFCSPIGLVPKKVDGIQTGW